MHLSGRTTLSVLRGRLPVFVALISLFVVAPGEAYPRGEALSSGRATADTSDSPPSGSHPTVPVARQALSANTLTVWGGRSLTTASLIGNIQQAHLGILSFRYERLLLPRLAHGSPSEGGPTLTYTVDVFPVLRLSASPESIDPTSPDAPPASRTETVDTYGAGISPAGLRVTFRADRNVQPFFAASAGLLYFGQPIPSDRGKQFNFMFDVGTGLRVVLSPEVLLFAGYRYYHLSNGFRGQINPGVDANLLYFGVSFSP